jgi:hypothetical protein
LACKPKGSSGERIDTPAARALLALLNKEWLLLVDGADQADALSGLWPPGPYGNVRHTSRNLVLKDFAPNAVSAVADME